VSLARITQAFEPSEAHKGEPRTPLSNPAVKP